jgi:hypothetical protein
MRHQPHQDLLDGVLGVGWLPGEAQRQPVHPPLQPPAQFLQRRPITLPRCDRQRRHLV